MRRIDLQRQRPAATERSSYSMFGVPETFNYQGRQYQVPGSMGTTPDATFVGYIRGIAERNGIVSAAVTARSMLISQTRFLWRNTNVSATPGRTFGARDLAPLERPGPMTRAALLSLMEKDVSFAGTAYVYRKGNRLYRLRPDGVTVILGSQGEPIGDWMPPDAEVIGYVYRDPNKKHSPADMFLPNEIAAWSPEPHPLEWWRGSSWVTSIVQEIRNDGQATDHTSKFFENAATPNLVFTLDPSITPAQVAEYADIVDERHAGYRNAFKSIYLGGGADVKVVGSENAALGLRDIQGGYEARIASASRVPATVLGTREGMQGSALNSGNYSQTRRAWADGWYTPATDLLSGAFESIVSPPDDAELAADSSRVLFLQEDRKDAADIQGAKAIAMRQLVDAGYDPSSVVEAIETDDFSKLTHSGLFSVQLQPPGTGTADPAA